MKIAACEGKSELRLILHLIERGIFFAKTEELIDDRPIHMRQLKDIAALINTLDIDEKIEVYRIGDTQKDDYDLSGFEARKDNITIYKVCTKPEIEILVIISEGLYKDFCKKHHEHNISPKEYSRIYIKGYSSVEKYIDSHDIVPAIKEYKRIKKHKEDELYLADLIKDK